MDPHPLGEEAEEAFRMEGLEPVQHPAPGPPPLAPYNGHPKPSFIFNLNLFCYVGRYTTSLEIVKCVVFFPRNLLSDRSGEYNLI